MTTAIENMINTAIGLTILTSTVVAFAAFMGIFIYLFYDEELDFKAAVFLFIVFVGSMLVLTGTIGFAAERFG